MHLESLRREIEQECPGVTTDPYDAPPPRLVSSGPCSPSGGRPVARGTLRSTQSPGSTTRCSG